jgi:hypothetical protein
MEHAASLRSDRPRVIIRVDEDGCCCTCGRDVQGCYACDPQGRRLRMRLAFLEIARAEAVRRAERLDRYPFTPRMAEAIRILDAHGDIGGGAALRVLRGEPIVKERGGGE